MAISEKTRCRYEREDVENHRNRIDQLRAQGLAAMTFHDRMAFGYEWEAGRDWMIAQEERLKAYAEKKLEDCPKVTESPRKLWTARAAAKKLIDVYVRRGDTLESLRLSHMGHFGREWGASIGGACFTITEEGKYETIAQFPTSKIGVTSLNGERVCEIFPLKEIYEEIQRENDPNAPRQISLADVPEVVATPATSRPPKKAPEPLSGYVQEGLF